MRAILAGAFALTLAGCATQPATQTLVATGMSAAVDSAACAADEAAVKGKALAVALAAATDPVCIAALNALIAAGTAGAAMVTVKPAAAPVAAP